jgi:hypothetical protein
MSGTRAPMTRAKHAEPDMHLPAAKTCADCRHFERCRSIYGHVALDGVCRWAPSRFALRTIAPAPDWTPDEEEAFEQISAVGAQP